MCRAVVTELLATQRYDGFWGWLNRKLVFERQTPEELRPAVRCCGVTFSSLYAGDYAYVGFDFDVE